jgi:hypothetical protein
MALRARGASVGSVAKCVQHPEGARTDPKFEREIPRRNVFTASSLQSP